MRNLYKKVIAFVFLPVLAQAQDDMLSMMETGGPVKEPVAASFKTTRILNGHSVEQMAGKHLDFRINHRFGLLNSGVDQLWGLDFARIRLGLEYGLNDNIMIGVGRNNLGRKAWDFFGKVRVLRQTKGNEMPFTLSILGTTAVDIIKLENSTSLTDRSTHVLQVLLARKFSEKVSLQISPTFIHRNQVERKGLNHDILALGIGGRFKISKRTSFNLEYFLPMDQKNISIQKLRPTLSMGFDIETGGHVFQLHFTNAPGMIEKDFIPGTENSWGKGQISYGFNISRTFSFK